MILASFLWGLLTLKTIALAVCSNTGTLADPKFKADVVMRHVSLVTTQLLALCNWGIGKTRNGEMGNGK